MSRKQVRIDLGEDSSHGVDESGEPLPSRLWVRFRLEGTDGLFSIREVSRRPSALYCQVSAACHGKPSSSTQHTATTSSSPLGSERRSSSRTRVSIPEAVSADFSAERTDIHITPYRQFASQHPDQSHFFQPILDVLDYAPSALELVPDAVMVEGKSDYYFLRFYQELVLGSQSTTTSA